MFAANAFGWPFFGQAYAGPVGAKPIVLVALACQAPMSGLVDCPQPAK